MQADWQAGKACAFVQPASAMPSGAVPSAGCRYKLMRSCTRQPRQMLQTLADLGPRTTSSGKDWGMRGVQTGPGAMELTRIFLAASSAEAPLVKVMMAPCHMQPVEVLLLWGPDTWSRCRCQSACKALAKLTACTEQEQCRRAGTACSTASRVDCEGEHTLVEA